MSFFFTNKYVKMLGRMGGFTKSVELMLNSKHYNRLSGNKILKIEFMLNSINWPDKYLPGTTDNFASNEVIVKGLNVEDVWPYLTHIQDWDKYYENCSDAKYSEAGETELKANSKFSFNTFGFLVEADITEFEAPKNGVARIAWHGLSNAGRTDELNVVHAWLIENLPGDRVRILTQESQLGTPAAAMAGTNTMIDGHQAWLNGLVKYAFENKKK